LVEFHLRGEILVLEMVLVAQNLELAVAGANFREVVPELVEEEEGPVILFVCRNVKIYMSKRIFLGLVSSLLKNLAIN